MKSSRITSRLFFLVLLCSIFGTATIAFAKVLTKLSPVDTVDGQLSGQLLIHSAGVVLQTSNPFTITATGLSRGNVNISSTLISRLSPTYVFTPVNVSDLGGYGYGGYQGNTAPVTYTVQISAPQICYSATPLSYTVYLTQGNKIVNGLNFTAFYSSIPATITVDLTEVVQWVQPPTTNVIVPPAQAATNNNLSNVQYKLTRSDGYSTLSSALSTNTTVLFTDVLGAEPPDGSCAWTYTVTVNSIQPFEGVVPWTIVPGAGNIVTVSRDNPTAQVNFLVYHYSRFIPVMTRD
jgi:hypothetical protein